MFVCLVLFEDNKTSSSNNKVNNLTMKKVETAKKINVENMQKVKLRLDATKTKIYVYDASSL